MTQSKPFGMGERAPVSALAQILEARTRKLFEVDIEGFSGLAGVAVPKVKMRVATKAEQDAAILGAHKYVSERTKGSESAAKDPNIITDAMTCFILQTQIRDFENPNSLPAFPSPKWMMENFTRDELAVLLNHYNRIAAEDSPFHTKISDEIVEGFAKMAADFADSDISTMRLMRCEREYLVELVIALATKLREARENTQDEDRNGHLGSEEPGGPGTEEFVEDPDL